jgi:hypothetical protein
MQFEETGCRLLCDERDVMQNDPNYLDANATRCGVGNYVEITRLGSRIEPGERTQ